MGVPARFASEYPTRCLELIEAAEEHARAKSLIGSFALLAASAVLTIPFERMDKAHPLHRADKDAELSAALAALKKDRFLDAAFWEGKAPTTWLLSHVVSPIERVNAWGDEDGRHPFHKDAANDLKRKPATEVIRVIRNSLAHGNIIYLNKDGYEVPGEQMRFIAFLSRYEETEEQRAKSNTYRVLIVPEDDFLSFVKAWARWVGSLDADQRIVADAAA